MDIHRICQRTSDACFASADLVCKQDREAHPIAVLSSIHARREAMICTHAQSLTDAQDKEKRLDESSGTGRASPYLRFMELVHQRVSSLGSLDRLGVAFVREPAGGRTGVS